MMNCRRSLVASFVLLVLLATLLNAAPAQENKYAPSLLKGMQWRSIGPYRGGRSTAVAGVTSQPNVFYFGATGGGFFFSSRRRHTRWPRDWSSDVCSSD